MNNTVYTIGYTGFNIDSFVETLKYFGVTCLIDVRSSPYSQYYTDFNKENLESYLKNHKILYRNYALEFGARQSDKSFFTDGYLDFEKFAESNQFQKGLNKLYEGCKLNQVFALMCAEKDPYNCHRCILVGRQLALHGYEVRNIINNNGFSLQEEIDKRLIEAHFPRRKQLSLFEEDNLTDKECLEKAYKLRNKEIGYKLEDE